jgi:citrate lyase subunit beta/citryl-CoA lyase
MSHASKHPIRSFLFVPGSRPDRFGKALDSGADAVIIDLEDSVAPDAKADARRAVAGWAAPERKVLLRVNANDTPWFTEDAQLARLRGVGGIVLPKAESASDVIALVSLTKAKLPVFPLIETAKGMWNAMEIANAPFVAQIMFGTLDFITDMGMHADGADRLTAETMNGKRQGFGGKLCIHPKQVGVVNACYAPTESEVTWARRVLDASEKANGAAISVDGKMVDRPVVLRAQRVVELARDRYV